MFGKARNRLQGGRLGTACFLQHDICKQNNRTSSRRVVLPGLFFPGRGAFLFVVLWMLVCMKQIALHFFFVFFFNMSFGLSVMQNSPHILNCCHVFCIPLRVLYPFSGIPCLQQMIISVHVHFQISTLVQKMICRVCNCHVRKPWILQTNTLHP